jgi:ribosomal protein S18 acetylase RimI-like enzyme
MSTLPPPDSGHFWKLPFVWQPGDPPPPAPKLRFEPAEEPWLLEAVAAVMADSPDASDRHAVAELGAARAAAELLAVAPQWVEWPSAWQQAPLEGDGTRIGFVLPMLFKDHADWRDGRPQGTIWHLGMLPPFRACGHTHELLAQATRSFAESGCWRAFIDCDRDNAGMVRAFRAAAWREREAWQQPLG